MVLFDALNMTFRNVKIRGKMKDCAACSENPTVKDVALVDYEEFCQTKCSIYANIKLPSTNTVTV